MSLSLGVSADDAATDDIVDAGQAKAGRTEWEDALIKHGIMQAETQQLTDDDRQLAGVEERERRDQLAELSVDELDELEDDVDDRVLQQYRSHALHCTHSRRLTAVLCTAGSRDIPSSHPIPSHPIPSHPIPSHPIPSQSMPCNATGTTVPTLSNSPLCHLLSHCELLCGVASLCCTVLVSVQRSSIG